MGGSAHRRVRVHRAGEGYSATPIGSIRAVWSTKLGILRNIGRLMRSYCPGFYFYGEKCRNVKWDSLSPRVEKGPFGDGFRLTLNRLPRYYFCPTRRLCRAIFHVISPEWPR